MSDPYLYEEVSVLKNKLGIKNEKTLDRIEAEQSRANMMLLYEQGFQDFSPNGLRKIHRTLFGDIYEWAGQYRIINIEKREKLLAGRSVWYSNEDRIEEDSMRLLGGWEMLAGTASAGSNLFTSLPAFSRRSGRCIPSGRAIPERL